MNETNTMSVKDIRLNPLAFLERAKDAGKVNVIYRSKLIGTFEYKPAANAMKAVKRGSSEAVLAALNLIDAAPKPKLNQLDRNKSIKQLYAESLKLK